jgi:tape measure domain-containing protein
MAVDDKVVAMSFESSKFEAGVNKTINALNKLKSALSFPTAGKGFDDINAAAKRVDLSHIATAVDGIKSKLGALSVAALAIFADLAKKAVYAGANMIKALTITPILDGYHEYETQLNAIQTILANTKVAGTNLKDVNAALNQLNHYADLTIYNFSEMTKNIGTFTAAGVDLKTAVESIKGIANLAALSGSNADQASMAMYQLSQAISSGTVKLQDWNSVVNAGMGGAVFQRALAETALHMGTLKKGAVTLSGAMKTVKIDGLSFRQSLASAGPGKQSWLTSKVLTQTLSQLSGDLTDAKLKAEGYTDAQVKAIQTQAKMALNAATQVKTLTQLLDTTKEAVGSGWAQTWMLVFGNFGEAKTLFTGLSHTIGGFVAASANARNKVLKDWKALGGRTMLLDALKNAFEALAAVIRPIKDAFRDIFPAMTGKRLAELTREFKNFTKTLMPSQTTVDNLRRTFRGLFAFLDIGKQIVTGILTVFGRMFGVISRGAPGLLNLTGNIGDFIVSIDKALKKGDRLKNFFETLSKIIAIPMGVLGDLRMRIVNIFAGFDPLAMQNFFLNIAASFTPFQTILMTAKRLWDQLVAHLSGDSFQPVIDAINRQVAGLGTAISNAINNMNFDAMLQVIRTGLFGGLVVMFKQFLGKGSLVKQLTGGGGFLGNIHKVFGSLTNSLQAMEHNIQAKTLKEIAISIGLLTASVVALSFVDPHRLKSALAAMTVGFGELLGAMFVLTNVTKTAGFIKLPFIAAGLILLAGALDALSLAVLALSQLSWQELIKGLGGVGVMLGIVVAAVGPLSANSAGMIKAGIGLTAVAVALRILANAVAAFGAMDMATLGKGLGSVAVGLVIIAGAMQAMPMNMLVTGAGLVAVAVGLRLIANVVDAFGGMSMETIGKGMLGIGAGLVIIAGAMQLMPPSMIITSTGLLLVAVALKGIAKAVESMGGMSIGTIAKGLITLALALGILAAALYVMEGAAVGAAALTIAAIGVSMLAKALALLGTQSWTKIIKGLVALAAVFAVIGIAATLLTAAIPAMLGFGAALIVVGAGLALAGAGIALIGIGLSAIAVAAPTAIGIALQAFVQFEQGLIKSIKNLILGLLEIVKAVADVAPKFVDALVKIINSLLDVIIKAAPKIAEAFNALMDAGLAILSHNQDKYIQAGLDLLISLLQGIGKNIGAIVKSAANVIGKFLGSVASNLWRLISAGAQLVVSLLAGIAKNYAKMVAAGIEILGRFLGAIASNIGKVVTAGANIIIKLLSGIGKSIASVATAGANAVIHFINGIGSNGPKIIAAATNMIIKMMNALQKNSNRLADAGATAVINFLNGIAKTIKTREPELLAAGVNIGKAIVQGMIDGMGGMAGSLLHKAGSLVDSARKKLEFWHSPPDAYGKWLGQSLILGMANGIETAAPGVYAAAETISKETINTFESIFQITSPSKVMYDIGKYVGQGFAQGLHGSGDDIRGAFADLNSKLTDAMRTARETIASEQQKLDAERKASKPDAAAIKEAQRIIAENEVILARSAATRRTLVKGLSDEKAKLIGLAKSYSQVGEKLQAARDALDQAKQTRDDAIKGFSDQYSTLPDIVTTDAEGNSIDQLATYEDALKHQADAVSAYQSTLDQLRKLGLDDATYQKLLSEGTADQQFADQLLAGGKTAVDGLNTLDTNLQNVSKTLATNAAKNLYQAGVDAAQGLVKGLADQESDIAKAMEKIAEAMIKALKKKLKIKSPSEAFAEIGKFSMEGMAQGFSDSSKIVTDSIYDVSDDALTAMQKSMQDISAAVSDNLEANPVITPVLDLTQIRSQSEELAALTAPSPITAAVSASQASRISSAQLASQAEQTNIAPGGTSVKFEQNNYSPEALSAIEIYRQTKNQLSQVKSVLALT